MAEAFPESRNTDAALRCERRFSDQAVSGRQYGLRESYAVTSGYGSCRCGSGGEVPFLSRVECVPVFRICFVGSRMADAWDVATTSSPNGRAFGRGCAKSSAMPPIAAGCAIMTLHGRRMEAGCSITVPTRFLRDWVAAHYADRIRALWNSRERRRSSGSTSLVAGAATSRATPAELPGARGTVDRRRGEGYQRAARSALHLREFRRRQAQRARPCRRPPRRRSLRRPGAHGAVQPAVPLWRRRPRQDPSDACHRLAHPHAGSVRAR